jgi:hypothetical protein
LKAAIFTRLQGKESATEIPATGSGPLKPIRMNSIFPFAPIAKYAFFKQQFQSVV